LPVQDAQARFAQMVRRFNQAEAGIEAIDVLKCATTAIKACKDDWQAAVACLEALEQCERRTQQVVAPDRVVFNVTISACGKAGQVVKALELFEAMNRRRIRPDIFTFNSLISAFGNARQPGEAFKWFKEMRHRGYSPDTITCNALISAYGNAGQPGEALKWFEKMQRQGLSPDIVTYTAVISACETAGMHDKVSELLVKGIDGGVFKPTLGFDRESNRLDLHESAVQMQASRMDERDSGVAASLAKGIFRHLLGQQVINHETEFVVGQHGSDALKNAIKECMKEQHWTPQHPQDRWGEEENLGILQAAALPLQPAALGTAARVGSATGSRGQGAPAALPAPRSRTRHADLVQAFNQAEAGIEATNVLKFTTRRINECRNDWQAAVACLRALEQFKRRTRGGGVEHVEPDVAVFNAAISVCGKAGQLGKAIELFEEMKDRGIGPDTITFTTLISAHGNAGRPGDALKWFEKMPLEGLSPDAIAFRALISAYCHAGQPDEALKWLKEMLGRELAPTTKLFTALISAYGNAGQPREARELLKEMRRRGLAPTTITYTALISAYGNAGQPGKAREVFEEMLSQRLSPDTITYNALISAYVKAGQPREALKCFKDMRSRRLSPDAITFTGVISVFETAGMHDKVSELLAKGIDDGVFKPTLGFDRKLNKLDLHARAVLAQAGSPAERDHGVAGPVAKGIFRHLLGQQAINQGTLFVVSEHGANALGNAIEDCMKEQNWMPQHPRDPQGKVLLGALKAAALSLQPAAPGGMGTRPLNPDAAEFRPSAPTSRPAPLPAASGGMGRRPLPPSAAQPGPVPRRGGEFQAPHTRGGSASRS